MDDNLKTAKARIRAALKAGIRMTTAQGNRIGKTVDFRKIVSHLSAAGERNEDGQFRLIQDVTITTITLK